MVREREKRGAHRGVVREEPISEGRGQEGGAQVRGDMVREGGARERSYLMLMANSAVSFTLCRTR